MEQARTGFRLMQSNIQTLRLQARALIADPQASEETRQQVYVILAEVETAASSLDDIADAIFVAGVQSQR